MDNASALSVKATRPIIHYRTTIYAALYSSNTDMDDMRHSLSKTKKKIKHLLTGRKRKPDGMGPNPGGEGADSTTSVPQPELHVVADEGHDREEDTANAAGVRASSTDRPPQPDGPESVPARGNDNGQEGGEADVDRWEASQKDSHPHPDVEVAVGGAHGGELERVYPSPSTTSISRGVEPDST